MYQSLLKKLTLLSCVCIGFHGAYAQQGGELTGITVTGIKGDEHKVSDLIKYTNEHPVPKEKVHLKPEFDGPTPIGQSPEAKSVSSFGTSVNSSTTTAVSTTPTSNQFIGSNFLTIWGSYATVAGRESPYTPPDNCGDVGTTQIIATANCRMKVFTKPALGSPMVTSFGGSTQELSPVLDVDLNGLFTKSSLGISGISDPHVRFDRFTKRWFIVAIDINHNTNNYCCIAVSDGETVTANTNFTTYYFNVSGTGGSNLDFFDYPTLGVDNKSLYIGGNMFKSGRTFSGSNLWVVNKSNLVSGTLTVTGFPHSKTATDMYTPQGVQNDDDASTNGYFIGASQTYYSRFVIRRVSYSGSTPTLSSDLVLSTATTYTPKTVPTLGGTSIDGNDRRLCMAMIKKNLITGSSDLYVAQGTLLNISGVGGSGGDRDGALWAEITNLTGTPSIVQGANLYDNTNSASNAYNYTYPTIAMNGQGNFLMGMTAAGAPYYADAAFATRYRTDANGTFRAPVKLTSASNSYNPGASRWGDYTQTVVDPSDNMTMWTFTEYVPTTNSWGVRAAQLLAPPPPPLPQTTTFPGCGPITVALTGTSTANNAEFFDNTVGYNRLNVTVSGPSTIAVSNIVFNAAATNSIKATLDFTNAKSGTYTIYGVNPDGQKDSTQMTLSSVCGTPGIANTLRVSPMEQTVVVNRIYPNPASSSVTVELESKIGQAASIGVYSLGGQQLVYQAVQLSKGANQQQVSLERLAAGTYVVLVKDANGQVMVSEKIIKK